MFFFLSEEKIEDLKFSKRICSNRIPEGTTFNEANFVIGIGQRRKLILQT